MDYFNQLLDSYNKLKKRTFKLVYINEQGFQENQSSSEILVNAWNQSQAQDKKAAEAVPLSINPEYAAYGMTSKGPARMVRRVDGGSIPGAPKGAVFFNLDSNISPEQLERVASAIVGGTEQQSKIEGANLQTNAEATPPEDFVVRETLQKIKSLLLKACRDSKIKHSFCDENLGDSVQNWSRKLNNGKSVVYNKEIGKYEFKELDRELKITASLALEKFAKAALSDEKNNNCSKSINSVTFIKNNKDKIDRMVLHNSKNDRNGIVINMSDLEFSLYESLTKACGKNSVNISTIAASYSGDLSRVKGSLTENMVDFYYLIRNYKQNKELREQITSYILDFLSKNKSSLSEISKTFDSLGDIARDEESAFFQEVLSNQAAITENIDLFKQFLSIEQRKTSDLIGSVFPNSIGSFNSGEGELKSGGRSDRLFIYKDKESATRDILKNRSNLDIIPISIRDLKKLAIKDVQKKQLDIMLKSFELDEKDNKIVYVVGSGFKRLSTDSKGIDAGTVYSLSRLFKFMKDSIQSASDAKLEEGFLDKVDSILGLDAKEKINSMEFIKKLSEDFENYYSLLSGNVKIQNDKKQEIQTPDYARVSNLVDSIEKIFKDLTTSDQRKTRFGELIENKDTYINSEDPEVLKSFSLKLSRELILAKLENHLAGENRETALNTLLKMATITGGNKDEISQVLIQDKGQSSFFRHNQVFEILSDARKSKTLNISIEGGIIKFSDSRNPNIRVNLALEVQKGARIMPICTIPATTIRELRVSNIQESSSEEISEVLNFESFANIK
jgi:hypothetical protein